MADLSHGPDSQQAIMESFNRTYEALNVHNIGGSLVPDVFDQIDLTYVLSGNGAGQIQTATYKLQSLVMATLTLTYDSSNRVISVVRT